MNSRESTQTSIPRPLSLVRFVGHGLSAKAVHEYPFNAGDTYIFLGEIPNMPGHCVVAEQNSGRLYSGYHIENFRELTEDEV